MQEVPGQAENTSRYIYRGYQYHIDTTSVQIFRCSKRSSTRCPGTARVDEQGHVHVYKPHVGHEPNETIFEELQVQREMLDLATGTNTPLKEIFDTVCRRNPIVAPKLLFPKMKGAMQRARNKVRPIIPGSLQELAIALETYAPTESIYRGLVEGNDGSSALIFASQQLLEALGASSEIYVDGTFKVAPYHPPIAQLYTIHIRVLDTGIATVYILCGARTRALYSAVFAKIADLAPGIRENLKFIMGDYERAAMSALRTVFPDANLHGCWFHFNQALAKRWRHLGLSGAQTSILAMAMSLPLAPFERFDEGLALLAISADAIAEEHPAILQFMRYLRRQWSPLAEVVSVHGCPTRTNNLVESFHNEAKRKLGGLHPNIWKFIEHLADLITNQEFDLTRLRQGARPRRARTVRNMARDTVIRDAQHALSVGRFTLAEFLERCANRTAGLRVGWDNVQEEDAALDEVDLIEPGVLEPGEPIAEQPAQGRGRRRRPPPRNRAVPNPVQPGVEEVDVPLVMGPIQLPLRNVGDHNGGHEARPRSPEAQNGAGAGNLVRDGDEPELEVIEALIDRENEDIFHLPEDDFEVFELPASPIPFHRVEPLPVDGIERTNGAARPPGTCCVCLELPATHVLIPCGHLCCCATCATALDRARGCPLCRTLITGVQHVIADI